MSFIDSAFGYAAAENAEDAQYAATQQALAEQRKAYEEAKSGLSPYTQMGTDSTALISRLFGLGGQPSDMSSFFTSPGYKFRLQQGEDAIGRSAAANGGLFSGATGKALNDYAQGQASQEFNSYLDRLFGMSNNGQTAATNLGSMRMGNGANLANLQTQIGTNQANRIMNQSNALASGLGDLAGTGNVPSGGGGGGQQGAGAMQFLAMLGL